MRTYHVKKAISHCPTVNLDMLWTLVPTETYTAAKEGKLDGAPVIDVMKSGFFKVLGKGVLPKIPVVVRAKYFSGLAEKKIKAVGGAVQVSC
jgi:large subunit ribosomal protein L27Ae